MTETMHLPTGSRVRVRSEPDYPEPITGRVLESVGGGFRFGPDDEDLYTVFVSGREVLEVLAVASEPDVFMPDPVLEPAEPWKPGDTLDTFARYLRIHEHVPTLVERERQQAENWRRRTERHTK